MNQLREMSGVRPQFGMLRFQIGHVERRAAVEPVYVGDTIASHKSTTELVPVFRLLGWGETAVAAERRRKREAGL